MENFIQKGTQLRESARELVENYFKFHGDTQSGAIGKTTAEVFRECGFGWGEQNKATISNQQYWLVAILVQLEEGGLIERIEMAGKRDKPWRLK